MPLPIPIAIANRMSVGVANYITRPGPPRWYAGNSTSYCRSV